MTAPLLPALPGFDAPELIAHGTTALVFRATQTRLNRLVAIKVITTETGSSHINAARELATTVALSSQPHIVSIIDTGVTDDDRPFIVMEYCEGGSYAQILRNRGPLPTEDVIEVGIKIGEALHAAHEAGIVHRDVKPSNILRSRFGPALTDFGIARAPDELGGTLTREMMTPHHASPEALLHQAQSGLSDVYSLASTMWTLLVGLPPFVDPQQPVIDIYAFRDRVLHDPLPPIAREDAPAWLVAELTRALSKLPAQRHASARDFADALRRGTLGLPPIESPSAPATQRHSPGMAGQAWPLTDGASMGMPPAPPATTMPPAPPATTMPPAPLAKTPLTTPPIPVGSRVPDAPDRTEGPPTDDPTPPSSASPRKRWPSTDAPGDDEGGWLGSTDAESWSPREGVDPEAWSTPATRHFAERDLYPRQSRRRLVVATLIVGAVLAVASAALLSLTARGEDQPRADATSPATTGGPSPTTTRFLTAAQGAPRQIKLDDRGTSIIVSWVDPTAGAVPFVVTGKSTQGEPIGLREVRPSVTTTTYGNLNPQTNYCFLVSAIYSSTRVAPSAWTCTARRL